jgi:hypothetical protein
MTNFRQGCVSGKTTATPCQSKLCVAWCGTRFIGTLVVMPPVAMSDALKKAIAKPTDSGNPGDY